MYNEIQIMMNLYYKDLVITTKKKRSKNNLNKNNTKKKARTNRKINLSARADYH